jgi:hypothetical protein
MDDELVQIVPHETAVQREVLQRRSVGRSVAATQVADDNERDSRCDAEPKDEDEPPHD